MENTRKELEGIPYVISLNDLLNLVLQHKISATNLSLSSEKNTSRMLELSQNLEKSVNHLKIFLSEPISRNGVYLGDGYSEASNPVSHAARFDEVWNLFLKASSAYEETDRAYEKLIQTILELLSDAGYSFGLNLDPNPSSQHLVTIALNEMPRAQTELTDLMIMLLRGKSMTSKLTHQKVKGLLKIGKSIKERMLEMKRAFELSKDNELAAAKDAFIQYANAILQIMAFVDYPSQDFNPEFFEDADLWKKSQNFMKVMMEAQVKILNSRSTLITIYRWSTLVPIILVGAIILISVALRLVSRHLISLYEHLDELSKGQFQKNCFCSNSSDEFGEIGKSFDRMSQKVQSIVHELQSIGQQLGDTSSQITMTIHEQDSRFSLQESNIQKMQETALLISQNARKLADIMNQLMLGSRQESLAESARTNLIRMQENMPNLAQASSAIVATLMGINDKVKGMSRLVSFMTKASDQANLLSLNAAIETANVNLNRQSFMEITQKIQRFAESSSSSATDIKIIIQQMFGYVEKVLQEGEHCLDEINEGAQRLFLVSDQLNSIGYYGTEQSRKFENVDIAIQNQALTAEKMIESIENLRILTAENKHSIHQLPATISHLASQQIELQKVLNELIQSGEDRNLAEM